ncbi:MAG: cysteine desulfurase [Gracilibacteraceae bacterium]|jgi:cysteine desulfurase|nr:cysteine desulfurase [Gracilibacteraceae bacterium]
MQTEKKGIIYLDNSATTKPYPEAVALAVRHMTDAYGNPSSQHSLGRESKAAITLARKQVAAALGVRPDEIYFTSGGTESDNLAIFGSCSARDRQGSRIITTAVEHPAVTKAIRIWRRQGWHIDYIPVKGGELDMEAMAAAISEKTVLVSVMMVNNEIGTIFPIRAIRELIDRKKSPALLHCDAVQGFGKLPFTAADLGADLITVSAHKIHGVKGCGALYVKKKTKMFALQFGGGQERGLRPGTESAPLIAAFGEAVRITMANMAADTAQMTRLRDYCLDLLAERVPEAVINSSRRGAPHIVNFSLPGIGSDISVKHLSNRGIYVSNGAACKSNYEHKGPQVLESYGLQPTETASALRVSFCGQNTVEEVEALIDALRDFLDLGDARFPG